jgi:hypothetical protein
MTMVYVASSAFIYKRTKYQFGDSFSFNTSTATAFDTLESLLRSGALSLSAPTGPPNAPNSPVPDSKSVWWTGDGPPGGTLGVVNDMYLDITNLRFYGPKTQSGWGLGTKYQKKDSNLNWYNVKDFGAVGDGITDDTSAIQAAIDKADAYNAQTNTWGSGVRGGVVFFPHGKYKLKKALITDARIRLVGQTGSSYGGNASKLIADASGDFTNGSLAGKWMLKLSRNPVNQYSWWHAGGVELLMFDCNYVPGLGGIVGLGAGETSLVERVQIINSGVTARTTTQAAFNGTSAVVVTDGNFDVLEDMAATVTSSSFPTPPQIVLTDVVTTNGSPIITSAAGPFTSAHVGAEIIVGSGTNISIEPSAYVVSYQSPTQVTMSHNATATATGRNLTLGQARYYRIQQIIDSTHIVLTRPVPFTGTGTMTINRPRPGMRWYGGGATGLIRSLNVSGNSGAGLEFVEGGGNDLHSITGDNNGGALIRFHKSSDAADTGTTVIHSFKAENNEYGVVDYDAFGDHDPVILMDYCGMYNLEISGGVAYAGERGSRDLIRLQNSGPWQIGFPSLTIKGLEADNPYNVRFENLIRDVDTGRAIKCSSILSATGRFYPTVHWNKDNVFVNGDIVTDSRITTQFQPTHAKTTTRFLNFDPKSSIYNLKSSNSRKLRASLAKAATGTGLSDWVFYGGSKMMGHNAGLSNSWSNQLINLLNGQGYSYGGSGLTLVVPALTSGDTARFFFTGTWNSSAADGYATATTNGATVTWGSLRPGTNVDIWYRDTSGIFTYSIDNGSTVTVTPGGTNAWLKVTVGSLPNQTHRVVVTRNDASNATHLLGFNTYGSSGILQSNLSLVAANTFQYNGTTFGTLGFMARTVVPNPSVVFIGGGINDVLFSGGTPASVQSNLSTLIDRVRAQSSAPDVILVAEGSPGNDSLWAPVVNALYDLAETKDVPLIDLYDLEGSSTNLFSLGLYNSDNTQESPTGHAFVAECVARALIPGGPAAAPVERSASWMWMWNFPPDIEKTGAYNATIAGGMSVGGYGAAYATGGPQNAEWHWRIPVEPGTWRLSVLSDTNVDRGQVQFGISYDNGNNWTNIGAIVDLYSAAQVFNVRTVRTIAVTNRGTALLRAYVPSKNASSSGYFWFLGMMHWSRTA